MLFTNKQAKVIRDAWILIEAAVESSNQQERRLKASLRVSMKSFGPVAGRYHLMCEVSDGCIGLADPAILAEKSHCNDERILAYIVGNWIRARGRYTPAMGEAFTAARLAYREAQEANR